MPAGLVLPRPPFLLPLLLPLDEQETSYFAASAKTFNLSITSIKNTPRDFLEVIISLYIELRKHMFDILLFFFTLLISSLSLRMLIYHMTSRPSFSIEDGGLR